VILILIPCIEQYELAQLLKFEKNIYLKIRVTTFYKFGMVGKLLNINI